MTGAFSSPQLRWSAPPGSIAAQLYGEAPVSFFVEHGRMLRRQRVDFLLVPLRHCVTLGGADSSAPLGASRDHWLMWQSATGGAVPTLLPTEPQALACALGLESDGNAVTLACQAIIGDAVAVARQAVIEFVEAIYQGRAV